jgi:hypothetical protein
MRGSSQLSSHLDLLHPHAHGHVGGRCAYQEAHQRALHPTSAARTALKQPSGLDCVVKRVYLAVRITAEPKDDAVSIGVHIDTSVIASAHVRVDPA